MALHDNIKRIRELKGLSVQGLADRMDIDKAGIYKWEDGSTIPGGKKLTAIAEALGVTVNDLLAENITPVANEPAIKEKEARARETFYREFFEGNNEYSLLPKKILNEYDMYPKTDIEARTKERADAIDAFKKLIAHYEQEIEDLRLRLNIVTPPQNTK